MHDSVILQEFPKENRIIIDWVSFTTRLHTVSDIIRLLRLENVPFEILVGSKGKRYRYYFGGISIHYDEIQMDVITGDYVWLEMSGQGCRTFETHGNGNYQALFDAAIENPKEVHLTRLDVAFDDMTGVFDIDLLCDETRLENYTSFLKKYQSIYSNAGNTVYLGSRTSNLLIRIYDKAQERGYDKNEKHWIRCELQIKDENALGFIKKLQDKSISEVYRGVLKHYLLYREPSETDSNKRRWKIREWWDKFLDDAISMSIWAKPGVLYNLSVCEKYVLTQPASSIKTLIEIHGKNAFIEMIERVPPSKNPKYRRLKMEYEQNKRLKSTHSALNKLVLDVTEDEIWYFEDLRQCLNTLLHVAHNRPIYIDKKKNEPFDEIISRIEKLRDIKIPSYERYKTLDSDDSLEKTSESDVTFAEIHKSVVEKARQSKEEYRAAKSLEYLRRNGLDIIDKKE